MILLFQGDIPNPKIVGDTNFKMHYPAVNRQMAWHTLEPYIRQATREYILPFVGQAQYDSFVTQFQNHSKSDELTDLQDAIAYYTIYLAAPFQNVVIADMGITQNEGTDTGTRSATQWSFQTLRWEALINADKALDRVLDKFWAFGEELNTSDWPIYHSSIAKSYKNSCLFKTASDLSRHINIKDNFRTFVAFDPIIRDIIEHRIKPILCEELMTEICNFGETGTGSAHLAELFRLVQRATAKLALHNACTTLPITVAATGLVVQSESDGFNTRNNVLDSNERAKSLLQVTSERQGSTAIANIKAYLSKNREEFPQWASSPCGKTNDCLVGINTGPGGVYF